MMKRTFYSAGLVSVLALHAHAMAVGLQSPDAAPAPMVKLAQIPAPPAPPAPPPPAPPMPPMPAMPAMEHMVVMTEDKSSLSARELILNDNASGDVHVDVDASLNGQIRVDTGDNRTSCVSALSMDEQSASQAVVSLNNCTDLVRIAVPLHMSIVVTHRGSGNMAIGDTLGQVTINSQGSGDMTVGTVNTAIVTSSHEGDIAIGQVDGTLQSMQHGSGDLHVGTVNGEVVANSDGAGGVIIGQIHASSASISLSGSGDAVIGHGDIGDLVARLSGSGDLISTAVVHDVSADISGDGDVRLQRVTGTLLKKLSGDGNVSVGDKDLDTAIETAIAGSVAGAVSDLPTHKHTGKTSGGGTMPWIILMVVGFFIYRTMRRNNDWPPRWATWGPRRTAAAAPIDPAVQNIVDRLQRAESRLVRLENFVTTREFDLHRQFRDLDR